MASGGVPFHLTGSVIDEREDAQQRVGGTERPPGSLDKLARIAEQALLPTSTPTSFFEKLPPKVRERIHEYLVVKPEGIAVELSHPESFVNHATGR